MIGYFINKYNLKKYNGNWLNFSSSLVRAIKFDLHILNA